MKMPKKIEPEIESEEEEEFEEDEEEEDEEDELEVEPPKKKKLGRIPAKMPVKKKIREEPEEPKKRYTAFSNPQRAGIADAETGEVLAEGEYGVYQALADIIERLERIENSVGSMLEG